MKFKIYSDHLLSPEQAERLEDELAKLLGLWLLVGRIESPVTGNTTTFPVSDDKERKTNDR